MQQLQQAIQQKYQQEKVREKLQRQKEKNRAERLLIAEWEPRLLRLAEILPASVWLSSLTVERERLVMWGNVEKPEELPVLERNLELLSSVTGVEVGGMQRNANGQLAFTYTLTLSGGTDAD